MTDEEKKAIDIVKNITEDDLLNYWEGSEEPYNAIQIVLNLIENREKIIRDKDQIHEYDVKMIDEVKGEYVKLVKEDSKIIEKKDKMIQAMAEQLAGLTIWDIEVDEPLILRNKEDVIKYFEKEGK